jgi:hypothetical protein
MAKIKFRGIRMRGANKEKLGVINNIIEEYQSNGYVLTLRQLYYQLVSRDIIPNKQAEYSKLSTLLKEGRMAGIVDWDAIEDRLRKPDKPSSFNSPKDILKACVNQYKLPRMEGQNVYLEVWVEKDALSGVLKRVTEKYHVPILVNRGYSSASAMYDSFMRFVRNGVYYGRPIKILYLGDYDPSGLDMIRDIKERIIEFQEGYNDGTWVEEMQFSIEPIALTRKQIEQYNPPPNPAKVTDPRAKNFIEKYGNTSWEVDALRPEVLNNLLRDAILGNIDEEKYLDMVNKEGIDKKKLKSLMKYL